MKKLGELNLDNDEEVKQRIGKGKITTHISLFSGCGGLDLGFAQAGIETRAMVEFEHSACETLRANFTHKELSKREEYPNWMKPTDREPVIFERDICTVTTEELLKATDLQIGECSIISGGFPCQGFSLAGMRVRDDPRNSLYKQFVRIVDEAKPARILGENVPGIVSMGKGEVIHQICEDFAECGYDVAWKILNAADFGVPQNRKRVIFIGHRIDTAYFNEEGKMSFHIASQKGDIQHPYLFYERLKRWNTKESKELLKKIEEDPKVSFMEKEEKKK